MTPEPESREIKREESASPTFSAATGLTTPSPTQQRNNDLLDDVFGSSEPSSPVVAASSTDVANADSQPEHKDSSDIARLRSIHSTNGYRDGLAVAREANIQPGFDEGYSLGAALGLKAGLVVGSFESLCKAVQGEKNAKVKAQLEAITKRCVKELNRDNLFSEKYLDTDGVWKWETPPNTSLHDVAAAHPVVRTWLLKLDSVLHRLGVSTEKLEIRWTENSAPKADRPAKLPTLQSARRETNEASQVFDI